MNSLVFIISLGFLVCGVAYGYGAGTLRGGNATVAAVAKTFASLGGLLVMFLMIAQFIALFNWTKLPRSPPSGRPTSSNRPTSRRWSCCSSSSS